LPLRNRRRNFSSQCRLRVNRYRNRHVRLGPLYPQSPT
jgi:hypothetical protein